MRKKPFEQTDLSSEDIQEAMAPQSQEPPSQTPDSPPSDPVEYPPESAHQPGHSSQSQEKVFEIGDSLEMRLPKLEKQRQRRQDTGKRTQSLSDDRRGRYVKARQPSGGNGSEKPSTSDVALDATLRAAAPWQRSRIATTVVGEQKERAFVVKPEDVRVKVRERAVGTTILFVVDASGSMGAAERMRAAKGATLSLLTDAYQQRDRVALIAFRDQSAEILLSPTDSVDLAHSQLAKLPTGGRTPLTHGLAKALDLAQQIRRKNPQTLFLTVLISDGKANVPYQADSDQTPFEESISVAQKMVDQGMDLLVLDTEDGFLTLGLAQELATATGADYIKLASIEAESVRQAVQVELHELSGK
jgi:magnesium chelatase subunit D